MMTVTVIPNDGCFYRHHTPMIDTFSCVPFDLPYLIFKVERAKSNTFPLKSFNTSLKKSTLPATAVLFFTLRSNLHKGTSFFYVTAVKTNVT